MNAFITSLFTCLAVSAALAETPAPAPASASQRSDPLSNILVPGDDWKVAVDGLGFADGLSNDADGNLYFADLKGDNAGVYRLSPDGTKAKIASGGRSGTRLGPDGRLYACGGKTLVAFDLAANGKETPIADGLGTNDLAVSSRGHVYITDTGKKQITLLDPKTGKATPADTGITAPNGIGLSPDHATLYVSDYGGTNVYAFKVQPDGSLTDRKPAMTLKAPENKPTVAGGDGMTIDSAGRVYVTSALGLQIFDPQGKLVGVLPKPGTGPLVSAGFGGKDLDQLYVACGDKLYKRKTNTTGAAPSPRRDKRSAGPNPGADK
jgi:enterochelin esterase family protein